MKSAHFATLLSAMGQTESQLCKNSDRSSFIEVSKAFSIHGDEVVARCLKCARIPIYSNGSEEVDAELSNLIKKIESFLPLLQETGTAKVRKTVEVFLAFLEQSSFENVNELIDSIKQINFMNTEKEQENIADYYKSLLEDSYKDAKLFARVIQQLKKDKAVKVGLANEIANAFTGINKNRTKKNAIEAIAKKSKYYQDALKKRGSTGGKSAA